MERKGTTFLSNDNAFPELICLSRATCPNEGAEISHSAVTELHAGLVGNRSLALTQAPRSHRQSCDLSNWKVEQADAEGAWLKFHGKGLKTYVP